MPLSFIKKLFKKEPNKEVLNATYQINSWLTKPDDAEELGGNRYNIALTNKKIFEQLPEGTVFLQGLKEKLESKDISPAQTRELLGIYNEFLPIYESLEEAINNKSTLQDLANKGKPRQLDANEAALKKIFDRYKKIFGGHFADPNKHNRPN